LTERNISQAHQKIGFSNISAQLRIEPLFFLVRE
jgi:hypothetical protein